MKQYKEEEDEEKEPRPAPTLKELTPIGVMWRESKILNTGISRNKMTQLLEMAKIGVGALRRIWTGKFMLCT